MFILDLLFEDLAKETKEAPGRISLWTLCNVAVNFVFKQERFRYLLGDPRFHHLEPDKTTIATGVSIVLGGSRAGTRAGRTILPPGKKMRSCGSIALAPSCRFVETAH